MRRFVSGERKLPRRYPWAKSSSSESSDPEEDEKDRQGVKGYHEKGFTAGQGKGLSQIKDRVAYYASPRHVMDHLMRKTLNKNTWLYVADLKNNLYVGIKQTGKVTRSCLLLNED